MSGFLGQIMLNAVFWRVACRQSPQQGSSSRCMV
jgi:hypothetical protein